MMAVIPPVANVVGTGSYRGQASERLRPIDFPGWVSRQDMKAAGFDQNVTDNGQINKPLQRDIAN
jgi:hypothetical protein